MRLLLVSLLACSVAVAALADDAGPHDGGTRAADAGPTDAGSGDGSVSDGGPPDGSVDGGVPEPVLSPFNDGSFDLVDAETKDREVEAVIETAIRGLHPSMREAFRTQLRATLHLPRRIAIVRQNGLGRISWDDTALEAPLDGTETAQRGPEGRTIRVVFRDARGGLIAIQRTQAFSRTDRIAGHGHGLVVEIELRSRLLPRPILVTSSYDLHLP